MRAALLSQLAPRRQTIGDFWDVLTFFGGPVGTTTRMVVDPTYGVDDVFAVGEEAFEIVMQAVALAAPLVGMIPIIGQGVAAAMSFASGLALGLPIDEVLLNTVVNAIPGGAMVKVAATAAIDGVRTAIEGGSIADVALSAAREGVKQAAGGNDIVAGAFDAIVAVARGQQLQEAGFQFMNAWVPGGGDVASRAASFGLRMAEAAATGRSVESVLINEVRGALAALPAAQAVENEIDTGIRSLLSDPARYAEGYEALAASAGIPIDTARAAVMSVVEDAAGNLSVNPGVRLALVTHVDRDAPILGQAKQTAASKAASTSKAQDHARFAAQTYVEAARTSSQRKVLDLASQVNRVQSDWAPYERGTMPPLATPPDREVAQGEPSQTRTIAVIAGAAALASVAILWLGGRR